MNYMWVSNYWILLIDFWNHFMWTLIMLWKFISINGKVLQKNAFVSFISIYKYLK